MANRNQPIDLSIWIDTGIGGIIKSLTQRDMEDLLNEVYSVGDDIFKRLYQRFPSMELPCVPELQIQLSGELIRRKNMVYPGASARICREDGRDEPRHDRDARHEPRDTDINNRCPDDGFPVDTREKPLEYSSVVLGEFRASKSKRTIGTIILYPKAMDCCVYKSASDFETVFWVTLAHEVFHAFHYDQLKRSGKADRWNSPKKSGRVLVTESLAEYFKFTWLAKSYLANAKLLRYLESEWGRYDIDGSSNSGALAIWKSGYPGDLFERLFETSLYDWKTAADAIRTGYYLQSEEIRKLL